jgi:hypothetical protein
MYRGRSLFPGTAQTTTAHNAAAASAAAVAAQSSMDAIMQSIRPRGTTHASASPTGYANNNNNSASEAIPTHRQSSNSSYSGAAAATAAAAAKRNDPMSDARVRFLSAVKANYQVTPLLLLPSLLLLLSALSWCIVLAC